MEWYTHSFNYYSNQLAGCNLIENLHYNAINYYNSFYYYGDFIDGFASFADWLIGLLVIPLSFMDHYALGNGYNNNERYESLISVGGNNRSPLILQWAILGGAILSVLILACGFYKKIVKKTKIPREKGIKPCLKMSGLWLIHAPLFFLTILFVLMFSVPMWHIHDSMAERGDIGDILKKLNTFEENVFSSAQCAYDRVLIKGRANMKNAIGTLIANSTMMCNTDSFTANEKMIKQDQDAVNDLLESAMELLTYIKKFEENKVLVEIDGDLLYAETALTKVATELQLLKASLAEVVYKRFKDAMNATIQEKTAFEENIQSIIDKHFGPSLSKLDYDVKTLDNVKKSMDSAMRRIIESIKFYIDQFGQTETTSRRQYKLVDYILVQATVGFAGLFALIGLGVGFIALAFGMAHPPSMNFFPKLTRWIRHLLLFCFLLLGIFSITVFYISGSALKWSAPSKRVCDSLTNYDPNDEKSAFHQVLFDVKDHTGEQTIYNLANVIGKGYGFTLGSLLKSNVEKEALMSNFFEELAKTSRTIMQRKVLPDQSKLLHSFTKTLVVLEGIETTTDSTDPFIGLIKRQIKTFKRQTTELNLPSLTRMFITEGCQSYFDYYEPKRTFIDMYKNSFSLYKKRLENDDYKLKPISDMYQDSTKNFCIDWKLGSAGMWLAAMLLGIVLLLDMIVIFNVSIRLYAEEYISFANEVYESPAASSVTSPLLDDKHKDMSSFNEIASSIESSLKGANETSDEPLSMAQLAEKYSENNIYDI